MYRYFKVWFMCLIGGFTLTLLHPLYVWIIKDTTGFLLKPFMIFKVILAAFIFFILASRTMNNYSKKEIFLGAGLASVYNFFILLFTILIHQHSLQSIYHLSASIHFSLNEILFLPYHFFLIPYSNFLSIIQYYPKNIEIAASISPFLFYFYKLIFHNKKN